MLITEGEIEMGSSTRNKAVIFANRLEEGFAFSASPEELPQVRTLQELIGLWRKKATSENLLDRVSRWSERLPTDDKPYALVRNCVYLIFEITEVDFTISMLGGDSDKVLATIVVKFEGKKRVTLTAFDLESLAKRQAHMYTGMLWEADEKLGHVIMEKIQKTSPKIRIRNLLLEIYKKWVLDKSEARREVRNDTYDMELFI